MLGLTTSSESSSLTNGVSMPKHLSILLVLLALFLTSCQGYTPTPTQATSNESFADTPAAAPATPTKTLAATTVFDNTTSGASSMVGCTVQSPFPTPGPTEQSLFPPVGETDWVTGPDSAAITFIEYSDFQ
jgi:hypothetical protein